MGRRGRPYSKDPRKKHCMIRINDEEENMLNECCKKTGLGYADIFRTGLKYLHQRGSKEGTS